MTKRLRAKYKIDRRMGENIWGRPKSPVNIRSYGPGQHGQLRKSNNLRTKIEEAARLVIKNIVVPKLEEDLNNYFQNLINIKEITNIKEAVEYSLLE